MSIAAAASAEHPQPLIQSYLTGDLVCHLCGTLAGTVKSARQPLPRSVEFTPAGGAGPVQVLDWRRLRCARCNGGLFLEDLDVVQRRVEPVDVWSSERPRRGRPPKWLVEQRRREREEMERSAPGAQAA